MPSARRTVLIHAEVEEWVALLPADDQLLVHRAIELLASEGPGLGRPMVDQISDVVGITGERINKLKELRPRNYRVLFVFDKRQQAVLLAGGDKVSDGGHPWYVPHIHLAVARLKEHETAADAGRQLEELRRWENPHLSAPVDVPPNDAPAVHQSKARVRQRKVPQDSAGATPESRALTLARDVLTRLGHDVPPRAVDIPRVASEALVSELKKQGYTPGPAGIWSGKGHQPTIWLAVDGLQAVLLDENGRGQATYTMPLETLLTRALPRPRSARVSDDLVQRANSYWDDHGLRQQMNPKPPPNRKSPPRSAPQPPPRRKNFFTRWLNAEPPVPRRRH